MGAKRNGAALSAPELRALERAARARARVCARARKSARAVVTEVRLPRLPRRARRLGFWVNLPHAIIEEAYRDKNIPDRYCTVALMAENRHLIKANEELTHMCESMNEAMKSLSAQ